MTEGGRANYPPSAVRIGINDIGSRVTVRRKVSGGFSDTIGELLALGAENLDVRRASGEIVRLPVGEVVAARVVGR